MAKLKEIVDFLDQELRIVDTPDYEGAHNGLQLENDGQVTQIAVAVDASLATIKKAVAQGADLLVVHHGLFWQGVRVIRGSEYQKLKTALNGNLAIYSSHIPLDVHPTWGNNALLAKALNLSTTGTFLAWKGIELGVAGPWEGSWNELQEKMKQAGVPQIAAQRSREEVGRLGIITGGAGSEVAAVKQAGIDTFLTGEGPHWSFPLAQELELSVIHAGHYATETFGVRQIGEILAKKYEIKSAFLSLPTGL